MMQVLTSECVYTSNKPANVQACLLGWVVKPVLPKKSCTIAGLNGS